MLGIGVISTQVAVRRNGKVQSSQHVNKQEPHARIPDKRDGLAGEAGGYLFAVCGVICVNPCFFFKKETCMQS